MSVIMHFIIQKVNSFMQIFVCFIFLLCILLLLVLLNKFYYFSPILPIDFLLLKTPLLFFLSIR